MRVCVFGAGFLLVLILSVKRDSVLGVATGYRLDDPAMESPWRTRFFAPFQTVPWPHLASCSMRTASLSRGVKWPGCGVNHLPPSSCVVKGRIELYIYSSSGPPWPVLRRTLLILILYRSSLLQGFVEKGIRLSCN